MNENSQNVVGADDGYGDFKYANGLIGHIPSFVIPFVPKPKEDFTEGGKSKLQYIASEIDNQKYVVGDYAVKLSPNISWSGGERKHEDKRFPILFKTALGFMTKGNREVIDLLMMNLPIRYDTPDRRFTLESIAKGKHEVNISLDGVSFVRKSIIVEAVDIKKQPFGSLCDVILNNDGDMMEPDIAKGFNVVVDIGARTLNILTLEALEEQPELTIQTNDGMYAAYTQIGKYLENELGVIIPDGKLPQIILDKEIKGRDIEPLIKAAYENHANAILSVLDKLLINSFGFVTSIIFTGGGSEILRPYLERAFKNVNTIFLHRYANVKGLRKYGIRQAKKNSNRISVRVGSSDYRH